MESKQDYSDLERESQSERQKKGHQSGRPRSLSESDIGKPSKPINDKSALLLYQNHNIKTQGKNDFICLSIVCFGHGKDRKPYEPRVCLPDNTFLLMSIIVVSCTIGMFFLECDFNSPAP